METAVKQSRAAGLIFKIQHETIFVRTAKSEEVADRPKKKWIEAQYKVVRVSQKDYYFHFRTILLFQIHSISSQKCFLFIRLCYYASLKSTFFSYHLNESSVQFSPLFFDSFIYFPFIHFCFA